MKLTPRAEQILKKAQVIAQESGTETTGAEHIQLALLQDKDSIPYQIIDGEFGAESLYKKLSTYLNTKGYETPTNRASFLT